MFNFEHLQKGSTRYLEVHLPGAIGIASKLILMGTLNSTHDLTVIYVPCEYLYRLFLSSITVESCKRAFTP